MINRTILDYEDDFGDTTITCDCCGDDIHLNCCHWDSINEEKEDRGWFSRQVDGEWKEFCCKECYKAYLADRR